MREHLDRTKHSDNLHIRDYITYFIVYIFLMLCVFKHVIKIHYKNSIIFKLGILASMIVKYVWNVSIHSKSLYAHIGTKSCVDCRYLHNTDHLHIFKLTF